MWWIDWAKLILPLILTAILGIIFNTKLENHKHILQKKVQDFSLYNEKKHLCYAELYKLIKIAEGSILGLRGFTEKPSFEDYDKDDVGKYLDELKIPKKVFNQVVEMWDSEKDNAIKKIREYEKYRDLMDAKNSYAEARNFWLINELYFDDGIDSKLDDYFQTLYSLYVNYEIPEDVPRKVNSELKTKIQEKFNDIKQSMKKELSSFNEK